MNPPITGRLTPTKLQNPKPPTTATTPTATFIEMKPLTVRLPGRPASASLFWIPDIRSRPTRGWRNAPTRSMAERTNRSEKGCWSSISSRVTAWSRNWARRVSSKSWRGASAKPRKTKKTPTAAKIPRTTVSTISDLDARDLADDGVADAHHDQRERQHAPAQRLFEHR